MVRCIQSAVSKAVMVFLLVICLVTAGFAHSPVMSAEAVAKANYLSSMGLVAADLCAVPGADGEAMDMGDCPVCHLAGAMLMPAAGDGFARVEARVAAAVLVPAQAHVFGRVYNPATPVRAPPLA